MKKFGIVIIIILFFLTGCQESKKGVPSPGGSDSRAKDLTEAERKKLSQALISASAIGNIQKVQQLLNKGADIKAKSKIGWTALKTASHKHDREEIVKLLKSHGAR